MLIIAMILVTLPPQVPGASNVERVVNEPLVKSATYASRFQSGLSVVSNDGTAVFVNEGKYGHFVIENPRFAKLEDIFYFVIDGRPVSFTTSQYSYVFDDIETRSLDKDTRDVL